MPAHSDDGSIRENHMGVAFTHVARGVDSKSLPQSMQRCDAKRVMASVRVGKIAVWNAAVGCNPGDMVSKEVSALRSRSMAIATWWISPAALGG